jgi:hypothetical protein
MVAVRNTATLGLRPGDRPAVRHAHARRTLVCTTMQIAAVDQPFAVLWSRVRMFA